MSSSFDLFDAPTVASTITTVNGASELYLIDRSFNEVARGVGRLELPLVPGPYRVRERIGDIESVSDELKVVPGEQSDFVMPGVAYESPLPLAGTAAYQEMPQQLRHPRLTGPGVRIVIRDPQPGHGAQPRPDDGCMAAEVRRLRIETLTGQPVARLSEASTAVREKDLFAVDLVLDPGSYVLVQDAAGGRQSCIALYVLAQWHPAVYLLLPTRPEAGTGQRRLRLGDASLYYAAGNAAAQPDDVALARLEAARHALSRGRSISGWAQLPDAHGQPVFNPLLALIDAYLLLRSSPGAGGSPATLIDGAAAALGESFPDVQAVRMAQRKIALDSGSPTSVKHGEASALAAAGVTLATLTGPPILARSWRHLLEACNLTERPAAALPFEFAAEPSESWFVWSESAGARAADAAGTGAAAGVGSAQLLALAKRVFVAIAASDTGARWVDSVHQVAATQMQREENLFADPAMQRIVAALMTITDPILRKSFEEAPADLVERAWAGLQLPNVMLKTTLRKFARFLEQNKLMAGLVYATGWVLALNLLHSLKPPGGRNKAE